MEGVINEKPFYGDVNPAKFVTLIVYDYTAKLGLLQNGYVIKMLIVCRILSQYDIMSV